MLKILAILLMLTGVLGEKVSKEYVRRNNEFAIDVLGELNKGHKKNVLFSAFSPEIILGLMSQGAKGNTAAEIKKVVHLPSSDEEIRSDFNSVLGEVEKAKNVEIVMADQVYLAEGFKVEDEFLKTASDIFRAGVQNVNFSNSEKAVNDINAWVEEKTKNKIKNLITDDQITELTRMVLVNALYFKGNWLNPFKPENTTKKDFHISKTEKVQVDTMELDASLFVHKQDKHNMTFLKMPFRGTNNRATMTIILTDEIDALEQAYENLKPAILEQSYKRQEMKIFVPKFKVEATVDFKPLLKNLGMNELFTKPDLSGITKEAVKVDTITQKVFMDVTEYGTEAAAATAAISVARTLDLPPVPKAAYHVDRPFFFCLQYDEVILLAGRLVNPIQQ
ncbi:hypothetical protein HHI36_012208 [Cryptolaemus montrouzieri]|uniref:Serpin domain-containing protein n=1 Tax=Cryptolaemus montrouzieri TaxID=559131 RepID=A0ABD2NEE8_9CUCU